MKKINVYANGQYLWSTNRYEKCRDAKKGAEVIYKEMPSVRNTVRKIAKITKNKKITFRANFSKE